MCFVKLVSFVLLQCKKKNKKKKKKKNDIRRLDPEVSIISSKNEGEVPVEQYYTLDKFFFLQVNQQKRVGMVSTDNV